MRHNCKRAFAGVLALAMVMSSSITSDLKASGGSPGGSGELEGVLSDVFNVVVPTEANRPANENTLYTSAFDFILDPKGFASEAGGSLVGKNLEPNATVYFENLEQGAAYDYSSTSDGFTVINKGMVDVDVTLEATLTGMDGVRLIGDKNFTDDKSASVYLALIDNKGKTAAVDKFGAAKKTTLKGQPNGYKVIYNHTSGKYEYQIKSDAELQKDNIKFVDYTFRLTGACNSSSSWFMLSGYLEPVIDVEWHVTARPKNLAPSIVKTSYVMNTGKAVLVDVDLGAGNLAATGIKTITCTNSSGAASTLADSNYVFADGVLKFRAPYISGVIEEGIQSQRYTVTFNDSAGTQKILTLVANDDMAPSIAQTQYEMESGQPISVDIDFGAGTLGATAIQSITFVNANGATKTVSTNDYTIENGVLTFKSAYITSLISSGIVSRQFTITFNDRAKTRETITVSANGTMPTIAQTSYVISRGNETKISVDLGSGSLAADNIESITFINANGATKTIAADKYTFSGNELTFSEAYIAEVLNTGRISREHTITFNNASKTQVKVTLTALDKEPEIDQTQQTMINGQPVHINVDLGSGASGATGIQSITFVNANKVTKTVSADDYAFADGTLELKASYISTMLSSGIISRNFIITLNDKKNTTATVTVSANGTVPTVAQSSYTMNKGNDVAVGVDLGTGDLAASDIESITFVNANGVTKTVAADKYIFTGNTLTFKETYITEVLNTGKISREHTITFNNIAKTKAKVALVAPDEAPQIDQSQQTMTNGQPVRIDVDLGSGASRATGIQSITFVNANNVTKTVSTDDYVYMDGVLQLKASYISTMLSAGITSRNFLITLNDKANTSATVTVSATGTAPSIVQTSYTMSRGNEVKINVNPGSGELEATGIASITFVNANGVSKTISADKYSFAGNELVFKEAYIAEVLNTGKTSREHTITFNNVTKTQIKVTLNASDVAPSIQTKNYTIASGKPVLINVDLGSGASGATGIRSITYLASGKSTTVPTSYYVLENGVLKLTASYINGLISAKVQEREYKITFNNKQGTIETIKLSQ